MMYEIRVEERTIQVNCHERIPEDVLEILKTSAEENNSVWNTNANKSMFIVACKSLEIQKRLLNLYNFLLDYNW